MLVALVPIASGRAPWIHIGVGLLLIGGMSAVFGLRDAIVLVLRRRGREPDPNRVLTHMGAAGLAALVAAMTFGTNDPRLQGNAPWGYVIGAGLAVYLFDFLYDKTMRAVAWLLGRLAGDR